MRDLIKSGAVLALCIFSSTHALSSSEPLIISGSVNGYETRNFDNKLDFGLVIPAQTKTQIMDFRLSSVLSTKTDVIRAAGQSIEVPSNLSLPSQRERYFITIRINKPNFRLPLHSENVPTDVVVLEGHMPFKSTVDTLRGGSPLFSVINSFTFKSYTTSNLLDLESELNLTAGQNQIEGEKVLFEMPFETDEDYVSLGLNLNSIISDEGVATYFPINIKTLESPQSLTSFDELSTPLIVSVPKKTFESTGEESEGKPFPFSLVWGDSTPSHTLPLGKDFVKVDQTDGFLVEIINSTLEDFTVLSFKVSTYDEALNLLSEEHFSELESIEFENSDEIFRLRVDVMAVDPDPILNSLRYFDNNDDLLNQAKYISRYEKDFK